MNILVTGAMGFIGSNTVIELLKANHNVMAFDNLSNSSINPTDRMKAAVTPEQWSKFVFFEVDIRNLGFMISVMANYRADAIVHLAAMGSVPRSFEDPSQFFEINTVGFSNVCCLASTMGISKMVYASSSSVYGDLSSAIMRTEGVEGKTLSPYAMTKRMNEEFAQMWFGKTGIIMTGLRFFNVYGPGQRFDSRYSAVIPKFLTATKDIKINGDGKNKRDFTYVGDAAKAILKAIAHKKTDIFNIGTGIGTEINDLAMLCTDQPIKRLEARQGEVISSVANTVKAWKELQWASVVNLRDGLKVTKEFYDGLKIPENNTTRDLSGSR